MDLPHFTNWVRSIYWVFPSIRLSGSPSHPLHQKQYFAKNPPPYSHSRRRHAKTQKQPLFLAHGFFGYISYTYVHMLVHQLNNSGFWRFSGFSDIFFLRFFSLFWPIHLTTKPATIFRSEDEVFGGWREGKGLMIEAALVSCSKVVDFFIFYFLALFWSVGRA